MLGENIKRLRQERNLSVPDALMLERLAEILEVTPEARLSSPERNDEHFLEMAGCLAEIQAYLADKRKRQQRRK